jgi:hypothetical protein
MYRSSKALRYRFAKLDEVVKYYIHGCYGNSLVWYKLTFPLREPTAFKGMMYELGLSDTL